MSRPRVRPAAAAALACGLLAVGTGVAGLIVAGHTGRGPLLPGRPTAIPAPAGRTAAPVPASTSAQAAARPAVARPVALVIPAIGLHTRLIRLGVTRSGGLQVPSTTKVAGWYTGGPRPGAIGPAVIAGHIDSYRGPGVFFRLRQLRRRDRIYVRRSDGALAVFKVTSVHTYPKDHFPTAAVYGPVPGAQLRLITCGGSFDRGLRSYLSNVVVYAVAASRPRGTRRAGGSTRPRGARPASILRRRVMTLRQQARPPVEHRIVLRHETRHEPHDTQLRGGPVTQDTIGPAARAPQAGIYRAARQDKPWGHELIFAAVEGKYVGKIIHVEAGHSLSLQYHREKEETISVLSGDALMLYGLAADQLTEQRFGPGDTIHLPPGVLHRITAVTDVTFVESSTAARGWREDVVRLEDAYGRSGTSAP